MFFTINFSNIYKTFIAVRKLGNILEK